MACLSSGFWWKSGSGSLYIAGYAIHHYHYRYAKPQEGERSWVPVTHTCNPSYLGGWDQEHCCLKPDWASTSLDSISKITSVKWTGGVAQAVEPILCKHKALSSNSSPTKKRKKKGEWASLLFKTTYGPIPLYVRLYSLLLFPQAQTSGISL
jgi:hypothetical protein